MGPAYCMCTCDNNQRKSNVYKKSISPAVVGSAFDPGKKTISHIQVLVN
jgi:hypothetical protein